MLNWWQFSDLPYKQIIQFVVNGENLNDAQNKGANLVMASVIGRIGNSLAVVQSASEESHSLF
jgi:hypothetical protein